ncbi:histidinol phosphate phosphatase domain-containing protein [Paenibacillus sp. P46E]|uniref:histidinol phosphate phosphatase domain-containing protein n=1 Tax=Paenibacillus sp. P46E TaxID=1349436 RepID=UPI00093E5A21|nr:histidinol phosphate phosphatase domain-containing protein [Paenibacillus sp. P46E]OKP95430.1 histidinol-phosphatase [Paenibacillus sp. P46E]
MKVDFHLHLEEGPYSPRWLQRTLESLTAMKGSSEQIHTLSWMEESFRLLERRIAGGAFTTEWLDLYLEQAKKRGLQTVGIVDHLYRFTKYKAYYEKHMILDDTWIGRLQREWLDQVCMADSDDFVRCIQLQKEKWRHEGIELRLGIEADYFPGCEQELSRILAEQPYDYVIGSVHFVDGWGFDNPATQTYFEQFDLEALYDRFFEIVGNAITSRLFDIVAHLDNLKAFNYRPDEQRLLSSYERIADLLIAHDTATEINAGMVYRYPIQEMCPSPAFLAVLAAKGVLFTTSTDAHFPEDLGGYTDQQLGLLKQAGIRDIVTFHNRQRSRHGLE